MVFIFQFMIHMREILTGRNATFLLNIEEPITVAVLLTVEWMAWNGVQLLRTMIKMKSLDSAQANVGSFYVKNILHFVSFYLKISFSQSY